jgi:hypothetical protein
MIPRLRGWCTAVPAAVLLWCGLPGTPLVGTPLVGASFAYAAAPSPPGEQEATGSDRIAGRQAGVGRVRPGRAPGAEAVRPAPARVRQAPPSRPPATRPAAPRPVPEGPVPESPVPARLGQAVAEPGPLGFRPLPLGSGIALVGLGLGFLAMRLRRQ